MAVITNLTSGPYTPTGRGAAYQYTGNPWYQQTAPWVQPPPQYAGGTPTWNEAGAGWRASPYENNPQAYWNLRNQVSGLGGGYNPNGMGMWNPWANYGSSAMGGFQGGLGRPGLGYGTNPNMPTQWQGLWGSNPWASYGMASPGSQNKRPMDHIGQ